MEEGNLNSIIVSDDASHLESEQQQEENDDLIQTYQPLAWNDVTTAMQTYIDTFDNLQELWEEECSKYEETIRLEVVADKNKKKPSSRPEEILTETRAVPRRNYYHPDGKVADPSLYPYDDAFYPLLDAYDGLYDDPHEQPMPPHAIRPTESGVNSRWTEEELEGYLPCSFEALLYCGLAPLPHSAAQKEELVHSTEEEQEEEQDEDISPLVRPEVSQIYLERRGFISFVERLSKPLGVERTVLQQKVLPKGLTPFMTANFLKLLRHALSELQRDHLLATSVILKFAKEYAFRDVAVLRQVLAMIDAEYIFCDAPCQDEEGLNHVCQSWGYFTHLMLPALTDWGLEYVTAEHALCVVGFVRGIYTRAFGHLFVTGGDKTERHKAQLKRAAVARRAEEHPQDVDTRKNIPIDLVVSLIRGLGAHALHDRRQMIIINEEGANGSRVLPLVKYVKEHDTTYLEYGRAATAKLLDSYLNCLRSLIEIGEATLCMLPESDMFGTIASALVSSVCQAVGGEHMIPNKQREDIYLLSQTPLSLISPMRYARIILNATRERRDLHEILHRGDQSPMLQAVRVACFGRPPLNILNMVKGLFLRDMVGIREAGLGYGDFLVLSRFDVSPLDPMLFWREYNYPVEEDDSDEDEMEDDDMDQAPVNWESSDESSHVLTCGELRARLDFTLFALLYAWHRPWTPDTHMSFQHEFRQAVTTVALCAYRKGMPNEITLKIASYLARDWWPDERNQCFSYACQAEQVTKAIRGRNWDRNSDLTVKYNAEKVPCLACGIPYYCSKQCKEDDYKAGHKNACCRPPFCVDSRPEHINLFQSVLGDGLFDLIKPHDVPHVAGGPTDVAMGGQLEADTNAGEEDEEDANDDGSWESIDTNDDGEEDNEQENPRTTLIWDFFHRSTYKLQR